MYASLGENGRMAVVLDTGAVSRGSGNTGSSKERDIRKRFVEEDLIEAVVLLPENLFYNTIAAGIILVINTTKSHPGEILLVNASRLFSRGRPKNYLAEEHVSAVARTYRDWSIEAGLSTVIPIAEAVSSDYNLSPGRYVVQGSVDEVLPLEEAVVLLREAEEERAEADRDVNRVLASLGLEAIT
jgi:type I restriction enzyme M protein